MGQDLVCKQCGKSFKYRKAFYGHTRTHSAPTNIEAKGEEEVDDKDLSKWIHKTKEADLDVIKAASILMGLSRSKREVVAQDNIHVAAEIMTRKEKAKGEVEPEMKKGLKINAEQSASLKQRLFKCPICDKPFPTYQALGGHVARHKNKNKASIQDREGSGYALTKRCYRKKGTTVDQDGEHQCELCGMTFPTGQSTHACALRS